MARINLLPWRAERRKQRQKEFSIMLAASAIGALLLSFLIISFYNGQISGENDRIQFLNDQIIQLDKQITEIEALDAQKAKLLARKDVIEQLQANRSQMVHLFDSLVRTIPDGVVLTSIKQDGQTLTLEGRAQSNARVSTYLRSLDESGWMSRPDLSIIEAKGDDKGLPYQFALQVKLANPNAPKDEDGDGIPDVAPAPVDEVGSAESPAAAQAAPEGAPAALVPAPVESSEMPAPAPANQPAESSEAAPKGDAS